MQAGSIRGYLDLAGYQAEAVPQRLGYNQPPCLVYGRAHTINDTMRLADVTGDRISTTGSGGSVSFAPPIGSMRPLRDQDRMGLRQLEVAPAVSSGPRRTCVR